MQVAVAGGDLVHTRERGARRVGRRRVDEDGEGAAVIGREILELLARLQRLAAGDLPAAARQAVGLVAEK